MYSTTTGSLPLCFCRFALPAYAKCVTTVGIATIPPQSILNKQKKVGDAKEVAIAGLDCCRTHGTWSDAGKYVQEGNGKPSMVLIKTRKTSHTHHEGVNETNGYILRLFGQIPLYSGVREAHLEQRCHHPSKRHKSFFHAYASRHIMSPSTTKNCTGKIYLLVYHSHECEPDPMKACLFHWFC